METNTAPAEISPGTLDAKQTPFDPARHLPRLNTKSGRWMPRSPGRRKLPPKTEIPRTDTPAHSDTAPAPEIPANATETPPPAATPAPSFADIEAAAGAAPKLDATGSPAKDGNAQIVDDSADATLTPEDTGEIAARAAYAVTGALIGDHKAANATGAEHANIKRVVGSYCRARGFAFVGGLALLGTFIAYALGDARREAIVDRIKALFARSKSAPAAPAVVNTPAPAPAPVQPQPDPVNVDGNRPAVPPLAPVALPASR